MAVTNGYATVTNYKARHDIEDNDDDIAIEAYINAVSRLIDGIRGERFYTTTSDETRYFDAHKWDYLHTGIRIVSITTLKTDNDNDGTYEYTWTDGTDYYLMPYNASLDGEPYRWIETAPNGNYSFPKGVQKGVQIVGKFGWSTVPAYISEACYLGVARLMSRQDTPLGVSAAASVGQLSLKVDTLRNDPDFMALVMTDKRAF